MAIAGKLLQILVLLLLVIPVTCVFLLMHLVVFVQIILLLIGPSKPSRIEPYHSGPMFDIARVSTEEELDFKLHRSSTYILQLTFGSLWQFSRLVAGEQRVPLIPDHVLYDVIMNSVMSYGLRRPADRTNDKYVDDDTSDIEWQLDFPIEHYQLFPIFYWDVKRLRIHRDRSLSLVDRADRVHRPGMDTWKLAKAHVQVQLTFYAPGNAHNHVHFVFPTLMATLVRQVLPPTSVLRQLLEPHTRFTQFINHKALYDCKSSTNERSAMQLAFCPWLSFPVRNPDFLSGIKYNCEKFYFTRHRLLCDLHRGVPYHDFLHEYRLVVREYVHEMEPLVRDDYERLASAASDHLPTLREHELVDVVTALVWNCAVVHYCDHHTYTRQFAFRYGCMGMRIPLVKDDERRANGHVTDELGSDVTACSPEREVTWFAADDVYRTRCFVGTFVDFHRCPFLDMSLAKTKYAYTDARAKEAARRFATRLRATCERQRADGRNFVDVDQIVRTVCF